MLSRAHASARLKDIIDENHESKAACYTAGSSEPVSYGVLREAIRRYAEKLAAVSKPQLVFLVASNSLDLLSAYLACLFTGSPAVILEPNLSLCHRLIEIYKPNVILSDIKLELPPPYLRGTIHSTARLFLSYLPIAYPIEPHENLAILLSTSGSLGVPKLVRLSFENLFSNAAAIASYLRLTEDEIAIQSLPISYAYGLSILNSTLLSQGAVMFPTRPFFHPSYWMEAARLNCTSFAGVPYMYETLYRRGILPSQVRSLRYATQAGGALSTNLISHFHEDCDRTSKRFYVMYGQTEATARIAYVPPDNLKRKLGAVGIPIPGGNLELSRLNTDELGSELIYRGPNVMMGYATSNQDLAKGDCLQGILRTGDLASIDEDGYCKILGRIDRTIKQYGRRIDLTSMEDVLIASFGCAVAVVASGSSLRVFVTDAKAAPSIAQYLAERLGIPAIHFEILKIAEIPLTTSGKIDYGTLAR